MKYIFKILTVALLLISCTEAWATEEVDSVAVVSENTVFDSKQYNKWTKSSYFRKGAKALASATESEDYKTALKYFEKENKQHPRNGYAKCNAAMCRSIIAQNSLNQLIYDIIFESGLEETQMDSAYKEQLKPINKELVEASKMMGVGINLIPVADKVTRCKAYMEYADINDKSNRGPVAVEECLKQAVKVHPCYESYYRLLEYYINKNEIETATQVAIKAGKLLEHDDNVQLLMAAAYHDSGDDDNTMLALNRVLSRDPLNADALRMRCKLHTNQGNYKAALSDIDVLVDNNELHNPYDLLSGIAQKDDNGMSLVMDYVKTRRIKDEAISEKDEAGDDNSINWDVVEGLLYFVLKNDYKSSATCFEKAAKSSSSASLMGILSRNYFVIGKVDKALFIYDLANSLQRQGTDIEDKEEQDEPKDFLAEKIDIEMKCGMADKVIHDAKVYEIVNGTKNMATACSALGWAYTVKKQFNDAIKVYDRWAEVDAGNITPRYNSARVKALAGMTAEANAELQTMLDTLDLTGNDELKMCMLYYKGDVDEAKIILDRLAANTDRVNAMSQEARDSAEQLPEVVSLYNLACFYSLMGDSERAIEYLRQNYESEEDGSFYFDYAFLDNDFENIRENPKFIQLVNEYKTRWQNGDYKPLKI